MKDAAPANRLAQIREEAGMSRPALADHLGIGETQVKRMENGSVLIASKHIGPLTRLFDVTSDYLLGLDRQPLETGKAA